MPRKPQKRSLLDRLLGRNTAKSKVSTVKLANQIKAGKAAPKGPFAGTKGGKAYLRIAEDELKAQSKPKPGRVGKR